MADFRPYLASLTAPLAAAVAHLARLPGAQAFLSTWGALSALFVVSALPSAACWWWIAGAGRSSLIGPPRDRA